MKHLEIVGLIRTEAEAVELQNIFRAALSTGDLKIAHGVAKYDERLTNQIGPQLKSRKIGAQHKSKSLDPMPGTLPNSQTTSPAPAEA